MSVDPTSKASDSGHSCPLCGKVQAHAYRPFCSRGCRDRDLNAWFDEGYRLPIRPGDDSDDDAIATADSSDDSSG